MTEKRRSAASAKAAEARRQKRRRQVMRNRLIFMLACLIVVLLIIFALVKLFSAHSSSGTTAETSTLTFSEDGSIVFEEVTDFDSGSYDKKDLESQSKDLVDSFNETYGAEVITLDDVTVKGDNAYMKTTYQDADIYSSFTSYTTYFASVESAVEAGYDFADTFMSVEDGASGAAVESDGASQFMDYQVAIVKQNVTVTVPGQIAYVTSSGVTVLSDDTVSICADEDNKDATELTYIVYLASSSGE